MVWSSRLKNAFSSLFPLPSRATFNTKLCIVSAKKFGVTEVSMETVTLISHATQSRLRSMLEKVSAVAQHRVDSCKVRTNTWAARSRTSKRNHNWLFPPNISHYTSFMLKMQLLMLTLTWVLIVEDTLVRLVRVRLLLYSIIRTTYNSYYNSKAKQNIYIYWSVVLFALELFIYIMCIYNVLININNNLIIIITEYILKCNLFL